MANSSTTLDLVSASQANKEVTVNAALDAASPAMLYGRRASTSAALTFGYYGGTVMIGSMPTQIANGTVTLAASATNYVEADPTTGAVSVNQTGFTAGRTALYQVITGASTVTSYTDLRVLGGGGGSGTVKSVNAKTPDGSGAVTLSASDVGADAAGAAASAIAAHNAASDPHPQYLTQAEGDSRYASSAAATGVSSVNGHTGTVTLSASDVSAVPTTALGAVSGVAQLGSDQKLLPAQLPDLGIVDYLGTVNSQSAMLALTGQKGDWCIRSDDGKVYTITGSNPASAASWTAMSYPVGNGGTVTSVDLAVPGLLYTVSGNPVTSSGTLTFTLKTQAANTFLAGPTSGAAAAPTMRAITGADLPLFGASGPSHAAGAVPDPGSTAGATRFLCENGGWSVPPGTSTGGFAGGEAAFSAPTVSTFTTQLNFSTTTGAVARPTVAEDFTAPDGTSGVRLRERGDGNNTNRLRSLLKSAPGGTTWTLLARLRLNSLITNWHALGITLYDSISGRSILYGWTSDGGPLGYVTWAAPSTYGSAVPVLSINSVLPTDCWFGFYYDGTNLNFLYSRDGHYFVNLKQTALTAYLTNAPSAGGICINPNCLGYPPQATVLECLSFYYASGAPPVPYLV